MRKKSLLKRTVATSMAVVMCVGLTACKGATPTLEEKKAEVEASAYQITEENENLELTMEDQPESSYWFPEQLLEWSPEEDKDLQFNISHVPLAKRMNRAELTPVNKTQNPNTEVMAISIMNSSTSGNAPHGLNKVNCNTFTYWQYVDKLVYWGGSSGEGLIVPPSPDVTDLGHKNGVPVIGTVFFPQPVAGGKLEWLDTFFAKDENGNFPMVDKLVLVAKTYGFDGWFINQETEDAENAGKPISKEFAKLYQEFIKAFKKTAPELDLVYYDSMNNKGAIDWQNALTDKNEMYMMDGSEQVADSMFMNFWWTADQLAKDKLLKASKKKAEKIGLDPYKLYAGVDIQANGYLTPIRWDLFEESDNSTYTSLGIYCPNWAYHSSSGFDEFQDKENAIWVNSSQDPSAEVKFNSNTQWRGVSRYVTERTAITELPFVTNFCVGNGYGFFEKGESISKLDWNNRSIGDVLPTYRWIMENEGENKLAPTFDVGSAYYGGNSLKFRGNVEKDKATTIKLYSADLPVEKDVKFTTVAKANVETALDAYVTYDDGTEEVLTGDKKVGTDWTTVSYDLSKAEGKKIRTLSYKLVASEANSEYELYLGNISIYRADDVKTATVSNVKVDGNEFDEDAMYAGARLSWDVEGETPYYEVYRINEDKTKSLLGVSNTNSFYVNTLPRTDETNKTVFEVVPVTMLLEQGKGETVEMEWPDNSIPKAKFVVSKTLVAPNEEVTFTSTSSENTKTVEWTLEGASKEKAEGENVTVTYAKEGVYKATITAKNDSGENESTVEGCIVVTSKVKAGEDLAVLSQGKKTEATSYVNENEKNDFAVDGDITKKWCATGTPPHELTIDLGAINTVSQVMIGHAEAGGEGADMNTKSYAISVSEDGKEFTEVFKATRNSAGSTLDTFAPVNARYVKLSVIKPTQGSDTAARIYEVEVAGMEGKL